MSMDISSWQQLTEIKAKVLELACALKEEDEETFGRELAISDLIMIGQDIHGLEEKFWINARA